MPGAVGSLLELEGHDARWRCRTAQGRMRFAVGAAEERTGLPSTLDIVPLAGWAARHTRHTHSWGRHWTCPQSARDEPSIEHVLLGQTTCVSRLAQPISEDCTRRGALVMLQIPIATLPRWTFRKSYSLVVLGPNTYQHRRPTTTLSTWAVAVFLFRPQP